MDEVVACTRCNAPLASALYNTPDLIRCPSCRAHIRVDAFPALYRVMAPGSSGETLAENEAGCFYHPGKKAVIPCDNCGRFLCAMCDVEFAGQHICPACLDSGKKKGQILDLQHHRVLYDSIAIRVALYPLILWPFTLISALIAFYLALRHWNTPTSIVRRTKVRFVLAIFLSSLQILAWLFGIGYLVTA